LLSSFSENQCFPIEHLIRAVAEIFQGAIFRYITQIDSSSSLLFLTHEHRGPYRGPVLCLDRQTSPDLQVSEREKGVLNV